MNKHNILEILRTGAVIAIFIVLFISAFDEKEPVHKHVEARAPVEDCCFSF